MMEIPWVKAAARAAKRQDKAKKQREKKKKKKKKKKCDHLCQTSNAGDESDASSVFDVKTPPSEQLRTHTAIHPPQLPVYTYIDGQDWTTQWIEDPWRYTARAYKEWDGSGFEVR
ncbi:hypothetical protein E4T44_00568 [Aureobasidium sp. EXF-8845]|nr:hypothetical protein E4T44_00568 [Aureobasidium sp. EXF-8845]KAI4857946.1 hypothetical protein E4T45_00549 [Aureobasidium sp. EXF-8846]